jgi:L-Ala-D/L-Glu epimerase
MTKTASTTLAVFNIYQCKRDEIMDEKIKKKGSLFWAGAEIAEISYRTMDIPLKEPFRFATNTLTSLPYAWVRIVTKDGTIGFGEAPTYWDPTGETQLAAIGAFQLWEGSLIGRSVFAVRDICSLIERVAPGAYAARCGIEMAILDVLAKIQGVPAVNILGGVQSDVRVNAVIGLLGDEADKDRRLENVIERVDTGTRIVKIKSSADSFERDVDLVRQICDRYGRMVTVFVDANQSWSDAYQAVRRIDELAAAGASWIEQPVLASDNLGQRYLYAKASLPVMLDEGVSDYISLANCITDGTVQYANLKLAKAGGPFSAMKFVNVAEANAIPYSIGSMVESGLGMLANYAVAQASQPLTSDFDAYSLVDDGLDVGFIRDGANLLRKDKNLPGLGYNLAQMEQAFARGQVI